MSKKLKQTELYKLHVALNAKMTNFHGWDMPLHYTGILAEHKAVRESAGIFDVSHMGEFFVEGTGALDFLNYVTCNDVSSLEDGKIQYTCLPTLQGTIVDDLTVYRLAENSYMLCVNSANIEKDWSHLQAHAEKFDVTMKDRSTEYSLIALQGRLALAALSQILGNPVADIEYYCFGYANYDGQQLIVARMGYTGEDGFEIFGSGKAIGKLWSDILSKNTDILPAGLGARDSLRLEVCFPLYGNDLDESHNLYESRLGWIVKLAKDNFLGKETLVNIKAQGIERKLTPFTVEDKGLPRQGQVILDDTGNQVGTVTSGAFSPMLNKGIGMAYIQGKNPSGDFVLSSGRRELKITTRKPPLYSSTNQ